MWKGMAGREAARFVGVPYGTFLYWVKTRVLCAAGGGQQGCRYRFTAGHLMRALTVVDLKDQGATLREIRAAMKRLEKVQTKDCRHRWLSVGPGGKVTRIVDTASQMIDEVRSGQRYLVDVAGLRGRVVRVQRKVG